MPSLLQLEYRPMRTFFVFCLLIHADVFVANAIPPPPPPGLANTPEAIGPASRRSPLVISEIHYHPAPRNDGLDTEFIEVLNTDIFSRDISGFRISGDITYTFPAGTVLAPTGMIVIARTPAQLELARGLSGVYGPYNGSLSSKGGQLRLRHSNLDAILFEVEYTPRKPWPVAANGMGSSMVLSRPSYGMRDPRAWSASPTIGGTPGTTESIPPAEFGCIHIHEVSANGFIELINQSQNTLDISGFILADNTWTNRYVFAPGSLLPGGEYISISEAQLPFSLPATGGRFALLAPGASHVMDAVETGATLGSTSYGRTAMGEWRVLQEPTPNAANASIERSVVFNEIHYHPLSDSADEEWIELYNPGNEEISIANWRLQGDVEFYFPLDATLPAKGRIVVAANRSLFQSHYPAISPSFVVGNWNGKLPNRGGHIQLERPLWPGDANSPFAPVDSVDYHDGGEWSEWADGGGSTLERRDFRAESSHGKTWAGSNETLAAPWTMFSATNRLELGRGACDEIQIIAMGASELLIDDLVIRSVSDAPGTSRLPNGTFDSSLSGWTLQGNHIRSRWQKGGVHRSPGCLRLISSGSGDNGVNRAEAFLSSPLLPGDWVEISCKARWLRGNPRVLLRLGGNWMEIPIALPTTDKPGTPGTINRYETTHIGPTFASPIQSPIFPAASEDVVIAMQISDPDGISSAQLAWRVDPATHLTYTAFRDDGIAPDRIAGDGEFTAYIPGLPAGSLVAWHVMASDNLGASSRWPSKPGKEALLRFGEMPEPTLIPSLRVWMTEANMQEWKNRQKLSNEPLDCTVVHAGARIIHGAGIRYRGSALIRPIYAGPTNSTTQVPGYRIDLPGDERLLGSQSLFIDGLEQPYRDNTLQRERMAYRMAEELGGVFPNARYTRLFLNGWQAGNIVTDVQQGDNDFLNQWFRSSDSGSLFELNYWFEFNNNPQIKVATLEDASFQAYTNHLGQLHLPRYRWNMNKKNHGSTGDDHTPIFTIVDALTSTNAPNYSAQVEAALDIPQFIRTMALRRIVNDWDGYGFFHGKNAYLYAPPLAAPASLLLWDLDFALGASGGRPPTFPLFEQIQDPVLIPFFENPAFLRAFYNEIGRAVNGPLTPGFFDALADEHYNVLLTAGVAAASPSSMKAWAAARRAYLQSEIDTLQATFAITTNDGMDFSITNQVVELSGTAPIGVAKLAMGDVPLDATWTSVTHWTAQVSLFAGTNRVEINALDAQGNLIPGMTDSIHITTPGGPASPNGRTALTEIHYHPPNRPGVSGKDLEFIELKNISSEVVDVGGTRISGGIDFLFPSPFLLPPGDFVVLASDLNAFAKAYPWSTAAGQFQGQLSNSGERIRWDDRTGSVLWDVTYSDTSPWPTAPDGGGPSLVPVTSAAIGDPATPGYWRASTMHGGSPGLDDPDPTDTHLRWVLSPSDSTASPGGTAQFYALAAGGPLVSYQWFRDGEALMDATYPALSISPIIALDYGSQYQCRALSGEQEIYSPLVQVLPPAGTPPLPPTFRITTLPNPSGEIEFSVQGGSGTILRLQEAEALPTPLWINSGPAWLGTGDWQSVLRPASTNIYRVYRVWSASP